jgi:hypothetical protein
MSVVEPQVVRQQRPKTTSSKACIYITDNQDNNAEWELNSTNYPEPSLWEFEHEDPEPVLYLPDGTPLFDEPTQAKIGF